MRRAARVDANQEEIVKALRAIGCSVQSLAMVGKGVPDVLCGYRGSNCLLEIKDGTKPPSERRLTPDEQEWHRAWRGRVVTVGSVREALQVIEGWR